MLGETIGNFRVLKLVGEGGMGEVYQGVDLMLDRPVAIKVLRPELARRPEIVERFRTEAVALAKLIHPNIATLFSFLRHGDAYFMVMEFAAGESLDRIIARHPRGLPEATALDWVCQTLLGIEHAHKHGVIHRDIKPANIMLSAEGTIKVMDFGIARLIGTGRLTRTGFLIGTPEYMAPEQIKGRDTDAASDIYALGVVLYELLNGQAPFQGASEFDVLRAQVEDQPPSLRGLGNPDISDAVAAAVEQAMAKAADQRFPSARHFRQALEAARSRPESPLPPAATRVATEPAPAISATPAASFAATAVQATIPATRMALPAEWPPVPASTPAVLPQNAPQEAAIRNQHALAGFLPTAPESRLRQLWRDYPAAITVAALLPLTLAIGWFRLSPGTAPPPVIVKPAAPPQTATVAPLNPPDPDGARQSPSEPFRIGLPRPTVTTPAQIPPAQPPIADAPPEPKSDAAPGNRRKPQPAEQPRAKSPAKTKPAAREPKSTTRRPDGDQQYFRSLKKDIGSFIGSDKDAGHRKGQRKEEYFDDVSKDIKRFLRN